MEKYKNIPVVILTAHADRDNVYMAKMLGVQGYIVKPVNAELLKERIRNVFSTVPGDKGPAADKKAREHARRPRESSKSGEEELIR